MLQSTESQRVGHGLVTEQQHKYTEASSCEAQPSCTRETALRGFSGLAEADAAGDALGSSLDAGQPSEYDPECDG